MTRDYTFSFDELNITANDIEAILELDNNIVEPIPTVIKNALSEAPEYIDIIGIFKTFYSIESDKNRGTLKIQDQVFRPAAIVNIQFKNATAAAVGVCTAGSEISSAASYHEKNGDQLYGFVLDVIGTVAVERAMEKIEEQLKLEMQSLGLGITDRFSPGYCEWNIAEQQKLFRLLPQGFNAIKLSDNSLMDPPKSVSAIIGIGTGLKQKGYRCYWCNEPKCTIRKTKQKKPDKKIS